LNTDGVDGVVLGLDTLSMVWY